MQTEIEKGGQGIQFPRRSLLCPNKSRTSAIVARNFALAFAHRAKGLVFFGNQTGKFIIVVVASC
ncbi:MAG: hypothetical protein AAB737_00530, partial [Patescibacteria group bacterium]